MTEATRYRLAYIARCEAIRARWIRRARIAGGAMGGCYAALIVTLALLLADWGAQAWTVMGASQ